MRKIKEQPKTLIYSFHVRPGVEAYEIPLSDNPDTLKAIVRKKTWDYLMQQGVSPMLRVDKNGYIECRAPSFDKYKRLARIIADAHSDQEVKTKDGNECNLLEDNLIKIDRDPPTYDRDNFLSDDAGYVHQDLVEYKTRPSDIPKPRWEDPLAGAWSQNKHIQQGKRFN